MQILNDGRLAAEGSVVNVDFDDHSVSAPLSLGMTGALEWGDLNDAQVRIRLTPDGRDIRGCSTCALHSVYRTAHSAATSGAS